MNNDQYPDLVAREQKLQADVLKLSEENLSLRFEVTQLQQEVPRLKVKSSYDLLSLRQTLPLQEDFMCLCFLCRTCFT